MKIISFKRLSNDLFAEYRCPVCGFPNSLTGYYDNYFFQKVNEQPRVRRCECGREFAVQWTREGVKVFE